MAVALWAAGFLALGWQAVPTEDLLVVMPDGFFDPAGTAARAEGVYQAVCKLWLKAPHLPPELVYPAPANTSPQAIEEASK